MIKLKELKNEEYIINSNMEVYRVEEVKNNTEKFIKDTWYIAHEYTEGGFSLGDHVNLSE